MDGRSRPYFCGVGQMLNFQQREALACGIHQVIETTPPDFRFFEFQFSRHQVYIYKLDHGIILLILADSSFVYTAHLELVEQLKQELQKDIVNAIATFRMLAGNTTLSRQDYWQPTKIETVPTLPKDAWMIAAEPSIPSPAPPSPVPAAPPPFPVSGCPPPLASTATLKETIAAINQLSKFTTQYLGSSVVTNYWKATRPEIPWLQQFQVERSAHIRCPASASASDNTVLTPEQQQWIQDWVEAFIQRCSKVIRHFPKTVQQGLDPQQQFILQVKSV